MIGRHSQRALLPALWVATLGADRIDFLGSRAPFHLTPFLVLTPVVVVSELLRRRMGSTPVVVTRAVLAYVALVLCLVSIVLVSVYVSDETSVSASRAALFVAMIAGTLSVVVTLPGARRETILAHGATIGIVVFAVFNLLEAGTFLGAVPERWVAGTVEVNLLTSPYAGIFPRLCGPVGDPNRAGFVLLFYGYVAARGLNRSTARRWWLTLAGFLLLLTLSRSAIAAAIAAFAVVLMERRRLSVGAAPAAAALASIGSLCVLLLVSPGVSSRMATVLSPFSQRLSVGEGSATSHVTLVRRGLEAATASVPRALIGLGFGSAYRMLDDIFPGDRYGNFHSLYVSMFAESGVFALIATIVLLAVPLFRRSPYRALVAGSVIFNVFYQATVEPVFWTLIALAWLTMPTGWNRGQTRALRPVLGESAGPTNERMEARA